MKRPGFSICLAIALCGVMSVWASAAQYSFQKVVFPTDTFTQLLGINDFDVIVGYHGMDVNKGIVFNPPSTFHNQNFPASVQTQVVGINNRFKTVGFYVDAGGATHGFQRTANNTFSNVDFPLTEFNQLLGQNNHAQAAGYYADPPDFSVDHAYIYDENARLFLPIVNPLWASSQATGINDQGVVCGFYIDGGGATHGFILNFGTLTTLDFPGSTSTQALGVNNEGQVVGFYGVGTGGTIHGFVYQGGHFNSVDDPHGVGTTTINGINNLGQIVGFYVDGKGNTDGFLGTPIP